MSTGAQAEVQLSALFFGLRPIIPQRPGIIHHVVRSMPVFAIAVAVAVVSMMTTRDYVLLGIAIAIALVALIALARDQSP